MKKTNIYKSIKGTFKYNILRVIRVILKSIYQIQFTEIENVNHYSSAYIDTFSIGKLR